MPSPAKHPVNLDGQRMPVSRTYTPRRWDAGSRELVVDFMLHGEGLASDWARSAGPGDEVAVSGQPGGAYNIAAPADWYVIGGDESALPAIATILEALPASIPARVLVEVESAAEEQPLPGRPGVEVTWLHRGERDAIIPGLELERAVRELAFPVGKGRVWVGCEAGVMRSIRRHLLDERGMERSEMYTHGYWKSGTENHPDHDVGQDM